jgi:hypothetical protein
MPATTIGDTCATVSVGRGRVELLDQSLEGSFECRLVLVGMSAEVDDLPINVIPVRA